MNKKINSSITYNEMIKFCLKHMKKVKNEEELQLLLNVTRLKLGIEFAMELDEKLRSKK